MKKAQSIVLYGVLTVLLGIIIFSSIFFLSTSLRRSNSKEMSSLLADTLLAKIENKILDLKALSELSYTPSQAFMNIPETLGNNRYNVLGSGSKLKVTVFGSDVIIREKEVGDNINITGLSYPPEIELIYDPSTNSVTIK